MGVVNKNDYPNSILHNGLKHKTNGNEATVAGDTDFVDGTKRTASRSGLKILRILQCLIGERCFLHL